MPRSRTLRPLLVLEILLAAGPGRAEEPRLDAQAIADRTPRPEEWQVPAIPLSDHFRSGELEAWRRYRTRERWTELAALALAGLTCALFLAAPGRSAHRGATRLAERLARAQPFRWRGFRGVGRFLARALGPDWGAAALFAGLYFAVGALLDLPIALLHEQAARSVGLSTYTAGLWLAHLGKGILVGVLLFSLLVFGLYGLIRRFPRRWWLLLAIPVGLALCAHRLLSPYSARLYHRIVPLEQAGLANGAELGRRLRRLASARGIALGEIRVIESSRVSRALNAYLAGWGPTRELVLFDTLVQTASVEEVEGVVAHELEHARTDSLLSETALSSLGMVLFLALLAGVLRLGSARLGLDGPGDIRTLPLLGLTAILAFNLLLPIANHRSRRAELEADRAALVLTGNPRALIALQERLARANKEDVRPSAFTRFWLFSHPPVAERIAQARWYQGWLAARGLGADREHVLRLRRATASMVLLERKSAGGERAPSEGQRWRARSREPIIAR
jgi:STE24 endopeptidase